MIRVPFDPYDFFGYIASGFVLVIGMELTLGFPQVLGQDLKPVDLAFLLLAVYVLGQVAATPAKALIEDGVIGRVLGRPSINLFREKPPLIRSTLFPNYYEALPVAVRNKILTKARSEGINEMGETLFLQIRYSKDVLSNDQLLSKLSGCLNKYGFSRNLAFSTLLISFALFMKLILSESPDLLKYCITAGVLAVLLLYRYLKFFRMYSFELFNVYGST